MRRLITMALLGLLAIPVLGSAVEAQQPRQSQVRIKKGGKDYDLVTKVDTLWRVRVDTITKTREVVVDRVVTKVDTVLVERPVWVSYNPPVVTNSPRCGGVCKTSIVVGVLAAGTGVYCAALDKNHCRRRKVTMGNSNTVVVNGVSRLQVMPYVGRRSLGLSGSYSFGH